MSSNVATVHLLHWKRIILNTETVFFFFTWNAQNYTKTADYDSSDFLQTKALNQLGPGKTISKTLLWLHSFSSLL